MQLLEKVYGPANEIVIVHCTNIPEQKMGRTRECTSCQKIEQITGTEFPTVLPANSCVPIPSLSLQYYNTANHFQPNV